ncbi:hypothetical protein [Maribellus mangrovi]|uniref:hypothetical protein n=1 Tax=Maribellus mangrovi TaxID=3133146 RepID=UPI0030EC9502
MKSLNLKYPRGGIKCTAPFSTKNKMIAVPQISGTNPGLAIALSLIVPGAGHMYMGRVNTGLKWFIAVMLGYSLFIVPGIILHTLCMYRTNLHNTTK